jgi:hypothetical protein
LGRPAAQLGCKSVGAKSAGVIDSGVRNAYPEISMKFKKRIKRLADILEKLGIAGAAIGLFHESGKGFGLGVWLLILSIILTMEDT